jgi:cation diffusion facilitator CzcD-associated flavoprotein CzcO
MSSQTYRIVIIGAGPGGLCMGKRLLDEGFKDFIILERADDVGGTWYSHRYPGCECSIPAVLYSFSFEQNNKWSEFNASQPEILAYMCHIADKYNLRPHCRFGNGVTRAEWSDTTSSWMLSLDSGEELEAEVIVSAVGMFNAPHYPDISGLDNFKGTKMHSAQWDSDYDFTRDRVAIIGSGATAVQLVPEIVKIAPQVYLFQRTPNWILPMIDFPFSHKRYMATIANPELYNDLRANVEREINAIIFTTSADFDPSKLAEFEAISLKTLSIVKDPEVRRKLRPKYPLGLKREPLSSNLYFPAFNEPNLELVTEPIAHINEHSIVTYDGRERAIDSIILATGYDTRKFLLAVDVVGRNGKHIAETWSNGPIAYLGIMISGFPNLFMLYGPNTHIGSIPSMIEAQVNYILHHLNKMAKDGLASVDVKPAAMQQYDYQIQSIIGRSFEWKTDIKSNYRPLGGRIVTTLPFPVTEYRRITATINHNAFSTMKIAAKGGLNKFKNTA